MFAIHFDDTLPGARMKMLELSGTEFRLYNGNLYNVYGQWVPIKNTSIAGPMVVDGLLMFDSITFDDGRCVGHSSSNFCFDVPVTLARVSSIVALEAAEKVIRVAL